MLFDAGNPYRNGPPPVVRLTWEDFDCAISPVNEAAMDREAEWTVVGYLAADNDLAPFIFDNLLAMKSVGSSDAMNVCALFDGPLITDALFARLNAGTPLADDICLRWPELPTNDQKTLGFALQLAGTFPAKRRVVILSGHGNGWRGALLDSNYGRRLVAQGRVQFPGTNDACNARWQAAHTAVQACTDAHFANGWAQARTPQSSRYDILALDACYMGNLETLAAFAGQAETLVVSEDLQPGEGYPYAELLTHLREHPTQTPEELGAYLVNQTKAFYGDPARRRAVTQVALRSDAVPPLIEALLSLATLLDVDDRQAFEAVRDAIEHAWPFPATGSIDLKGFVMKLLSHPSEDVRAAGRLFLERWSRAVVAAAADGGEDYASGVAIYASPTAPFDQSYIELAGELGLAAWAAFLQRYHVRLAAARTTEA